MNLNKRHLFERGNELFAYLQLNSGSNLPSEDQTTVQAEFQKLRNIVKLASDYVKTDDAKRILTFCTEDLDKALDAYEKHDDDGALKYLDSAKKRFDEARSDKSSKPTFVVGPDGGAEKIDDSSDG